MATPYSVKFEPDVPVMLKDGVTTYADIFRPDSPGKFPVLMQRTPYNKSLPGARTGSLDVIRAAMNGYAMVIQDVRGRHSSDGDFYTFVNETDDGYDSIEWAASQSWADGKVGMFGPSYVGATQWLAAKANPPSLTAIAPMVTASDYHEGWAWQGGAFELGFNLSWTFGPLVTGNWQNISKRLHFPPEQLDKLVAAKDNLTSEYFHLPGSNLPNLPKSTAPYYYDWLNHPEYDEYWQRISIEDSHHKISTPAINFGGWYDVFLGGTIRNFVGMSKNGATEDARRGQRLVIGPWIHGGSPISVSGQYNFGTNAASGAIDVMGRTLRYYDHWLKNKDNGVSEEPPVNIFVMGSNVWRYENEWPPERAKPTKYFLDSKGKANTLNGDGSLRLDKIGQDPPDIYVYNPINPVPTLGGQLCCDPAFQASGAYDQRPVETRDDVLVYTSPSMEMDTEVTGPVTVTLYASSSARDTDFTAKLLDVEPSGFARNLTDGIIRARHRYPREPASLINPGQIYEYTIDLWATSNLFKKGHSIRLEISSSNFPRFDRNCNTGETIGSDTNFSSAMQTIHHSSDYPSHVTLYVIPYE